jgi:hypothetical protein
MERGAVAGNSRVPMAAKCDQLAVTALKPNFNRVLEGDNRRRFR